MKKKCKFNMRENFLFSFFFLGFSIYLNYTRVNKKKKKENKGFLLLKKQ